MSRHALGLSLALALTTGSATAQLADWVSVPTSTNPTQLLAEETVAAVQDGFYVHCFSSVRRKFTSFLTQTVATLDIYNDCIIVQDGNTYYGFCSRTGKLDVLTTSAAGYLIVTAPNFFVVAVVDGNTVHGFSGLTGTWESATFSATPNVVVSRHTITASDGVTVACLGSYSGKFSYAPLAGPLAGFDAFGTCGYAQSNGTLYAFSAYRGTWTSAPVSASSSIYGMSTNSGYLIIDNGVTTTLYSSHTHSFTTLPAGTGVIIAGLEGLVRVDGSVAHAYSAATGGVVTRTFASPPSVNMADYVAVLQDSVGLYAFSICRGAYAPDLPGSWSADVNRSMAVATPTAGGTLQLYGAMGNQWVAAPAITNPEVHTLKTAVVLVDPAGGLYGFSVKGGPVAHVAAPYPDAIFEHGSLFIARNNMRLDAYNPQSKRFVTQYTSGPASVSLHENAGIAVYGNNAYGFSLWTDRWAHKPLPAGSLAFMCEVQCGFVFDGSQYSAYSGTAQISSYGNFPYFNKWNTVGGALGLHLSAEPGASGLMFLSPGRVSTPLPPYGTFLLDPSVLLITGLPNMPGDGLMPILGTIPDIPGVAGFTVYLQAAFDAGSGWYLTDSYEFTAF